MCREEANGINMSITSFYARRMKDLKMEQGIIFRRIVNSNECINSSPCRLRLPRDRQTPLNVNGCVSSTTRY